MKDYIYSQVTTFEDGTELGRLRCQALSIIPEMGTLIPWVESCAGVINFATTIDDSQLYRNRHQRLLLSSSMWDVAKDDSTKFTIYIRLHWLLATVRSIVTGTSRSDCLEALKEFSEEEILKMFIREYSPDILTPNVFHFVASNLISSIMFGAANKRYMDLGYTVAADDEWKRGDLIGVDETLPYFRKVVAELYMWSPLGPAFADEGKLT